MATATRAQTIPSDSRRPMRSPRYAMAIGILTRGYRAANGAIMDAFPPLANANRIVRFPSASVKPTAAANNHVRTDISLGSGSYTMINAAIGRNASKNQTADRLAEM